MDLSNGLQENSKFLDVPNIQYKLEIPNLVSYDPSEAEETFDRLQLMSNDEKGLEFDNESILKKSIITPDFMRRESIPPYKVSKYRLKKQRKIEREKKTGEGKVLCT